MQLAYFHLEGATLQWYRWMTKTKGPVTWAEFSLALLKRFERKKFDDAAEALSQLRQRIIVMLTKKSMRETFLVG